MKKLLLLAAVTILAAGCASSDKKEQQSSRLTAEDAKYQIIDQEFDNMLAPEANYEAVAPYEEQVGSSSYIQSVQGKKGAKKPSKKAAKAAKAEEKTAPASEPVSSPAPVTDQEILPEETPDTL